MIFRREDPRAEGRRRIKNTAMITGTIGGIAGAGAGGAYAYSQHVANPIIARKQKLQDVRQRFKTRVAHYNSIRNSNPVNLNKEMNDLIPRFPSKINGGTDKTAMLKQSRLGVQRSARAMHGLKASLKKTPRMFSKANRLRSLKYIGLNAAGNAAVFGGIGAAVSGIHNYLVRRRMNKRR